jgi:hypothetical protein
MKDVIIEAPEQQKTWKPVAAGIILLILGIYGMARGIARMETGSYLLPLFYGILGVEAPWIILILSGIMCIIGAVSALRRDIWDLAFAGAVFGLLSSWPLAVFVMILLWRSKDELI